jgi:hypothetical protein
MGKVEIYGVLDLALEPSSHCLTNNNVQNANKFFGLGENVDGSTHNTIKLKMGEVALKTLLTTANVTKDAAARTVCFEDFLLKQTHLPPLRMKRETIYLPLKNAVFLFAGGSKVLTEG